MARKRKSQSTAEESTAEDSAAATGDEVSAKSLYEVLGIEKTATQGEVKKAYHRLALQLHPDKNPGDETAHSRFQTLQRVFAVLGDAEKRKRYDETGSLEDSERLTGQDFDSLYEYYRSVYKQVSEEDIDAAFRDYRGSDEEAADLLCLYSSHGGRMAEVFAYQMCSEEAVDSHRFRDIIDAAIARGDATATKPYRAWSARVAKRSRPKNPVAWPPKEGPSSSKSSTEDLALAIKARAGAAEAGFSSMIARMEAKYGKQKPKGTKKCKA